MDANKPLRELLRDLAVIGLGILGAYFHVNGVPVRLPPPPPAVQVPQQPAPVQPIPPAVQMPPQVRSAVDPFQATVQIQAGNHLCSATILALRPAAGSYLALSAYHCIKGLSQGTLSLKDGRSFPFRVQATDPEADIALLRFDAPEGLPVASVAPSQPPVGAAVWQCGYSDERKPGRTAGRLRTGPDATGRLVSALVVRPGDSGAGIFLRDSGQLVGVVSQYRGNLCYGSGTAAINRLLRGPQGSGGCPGGVCPVS